MQRRFRTGLQWTAWISGSLLLGFLLFMLVGHLIGDANGPHGMRFTNDREVVAFVLFPVCTALGLLLAYRWPLLGGSVSVLSLLALMLLHPNLMRPVFGLLAMPGMLYIVHAIWKRRRAVD
ncbi:MAG TPA: hypothetical protein VGE21_00755 [Flavobacteriales bacterium]